MLWLAGIAGLFLLAATITGFWGIASLAHASWLEANDLPVGGYDSWGVTMLCLAALQGTAALLLIVAPKLGIALGIFLAALNMLAQLAVISAYPIWSLVGIAVNLMIITALVASRPRRI